MATAEIWSIVLAGGEGTRLGNITVDASGQRVPKQFCSLSGGATLLHDAMARAGWVSSPQRTCAVVAAAHRGWWERMALPLPRANVLVQPENRGTANGMLLALTEILRRDPDARVLLLPADHHIRKEAVFRQSLLQAAARVQQDDASLLLLGFAPEFADPELGYILPLAGADSDTAAVSGFVEKPTRPRAQELIAMGALWNTFVMAAPARILMQMMEARMGDCVRGFQALGRHGADPEALTSLYASLQSRDFSRDVMADMEQRLRVLRVPYCGWSDLGTPGRLVRVLRGRLPAAHDYNGPVFIDLSRRLNITRPVDTTRPEEVPTTALWQTG